MTLDPTLAYVRKAALPQATIGKSEVVLLDTAAGKYHGLKGPASRIWELLQSPMTLPAICNELVDQYDVDPAVCQSDVESFLAQLIEEKLIESRS